MRLQEQSQTDVRASHLGRYAFYVPRDAMNFIIQSLLNALSAGLVLLDKQLSYSVSWDQHCISGPSLASPSTVYVQCAHKLYLLRPCAQAYANVLC